MNFKTRLFVILWVAGVVGVLSFLLVDLKALLSVLPVPAETKIPPVTPALKLLSLKRVYLAGLSVFILGSLLSGLAPSLFQLVAARALQGFGGGIAQLSA